MTPLAELLIMVQGLDEGAHDFREVRTMKRLAHTVEQEAKP